MLTTAQNQFLTELYELCQKHQFAADLTGLSSALKCQSLSIVLYLQVHGLEGSKPRGLNLDLITNRL